MGREAEIRKYLAANFPDIKLRANMTYKQLLRIAQQQGGVLPASFSTEGLTEGRNPATEAAEAVVQDLPTKEEAVPSGGTDGQVLTKLSAGDYDMNWRTPTATGGGSGSVTSVGIVNGGGLTVSGSPITAAGDITLTLENSGVTAGAYTNANITVDNFGRITVAADGSAGGGTIGGSIANTQIAVGSGADAIGGSNALTFLGNALTLSTGSSDIPRIQLAKDTAAVTMQVTNNHELQLSDGSDDGSGPGAAIRLAGASYAAQTGVAGQLKLCANRTGTNSEILQIQTAAGYLRLGPQNASFCHFYTDRSYFYFNRAIQMDGGSFYAYNDDLEIKTDDSGSGQPTRIFVDAQVDEARIGLGNGFTQLNLPATECHVNGTIRQTAVTGAIVKADANGDLGGVTIGANLAFDGTTLSATGGGGGGASAFTDLTDTPADYAAQAGKIAQVKGDESGLEFTDPATMLASISVRDETVGVGVVPTLNFTGAGVTATLASPTQVDVTIPGGGGGGGSGPVIGSINVDTSIAATFSYPSGTTDLTVVLTGVQDIDALGPFIIPSPPAGHLYLNLIGQGTGTPDERGYIVQFTDAFIPGTPGSGGVMGIVVPFGNARFAWSGTNWLPIANGNWRRGQGFEDMG